MRNKYIRRDESTGRYLGDVNYWLHTDDYEENYFDHKCDEVVFPNHNNTKPSKVKISYLK